MIQPSHGQTPPQTPTPGGLTGAAGPQLTPSATLQLQYDQLASRIRDLRSQASILREQLRTRDPAMMSAVSAQLSNIDGQVKVLQDQQAALQTQMTLQGVRLRSGPSQGVPDSRGNGPGADG